MGLQPPAPMGSCSPSTISPSLTLFFSDQRHRAARTSPLSGETLTLSSDQPFLRWAPPISLPVSLSLPGHSQPQIQPSPSLSIFSDQTSHFYSPSFTLLLTVNQAAPFSPFLLSPFSTSHSIVHSLPSLAFTDQLTLSSAQPSLNFQPPFTLTTHLPSEAES